MAARPINMIMHFTHKFHPLEEFISENEYLCGGCKTPGAGKRYRCLECDFILHEYCGDCPEKLSTFMHQHKLTLILPILPSNRPPKIRFCDVCHDRVERLFYRCEDCEFYVHPLCTQLPQSLRHGLHRAHSLKLKSSPTKGICAVCDRKCSSWRYRCSPCGFDIHLDCVLVDIRQKVSHQERQRRVPDNFIPPGHHHPPPPFGPHFPPPPYGGGYYPHGFPDPPIPPGQFYHPNWGAQPHPNNQMVDGASSSEGTGKKMFALVGRLGMGVLSNAIFGIDIASFF